MLNSYIAVFAAALAAWLFGAAWYMGLGKQYQHALGLSPEDCKDKKMPIIPLVVCFVGELALAWTLFSLFPRLGVQSVLDGVMTGLILSLVFMVVPMLVNNMFGGRQPKLSLIDGGHWVGVAVIESAVLVLLR